MSDVDVAIVGGGIGGAALGGLLARALERIAAEPSLLMPLLAVYAGPEVIDAACFTRAFHERVFYAGEAA